MTRHRDLADYWILFLQRAHNIRQPTEFIGCSFVTAWQTDEIVET